jgi:hypothetical protein
MAETYDLKEEPDARSLVRRDDVDAVLITTPHHIHVAEALEAIQCGKHLLIEKPITTSVEDCDRILEAADRKGVVVAVGYHQRFRRNVSEACKVLRSGILGPILTVQVAMPGGILRGGRQLPPVGKRGFDQHIASQARLHLVRSQNGQFELPKGKEVMAAFLKANPKIDVLFAHNDDMGLGAIEAIEEAGLKPGKDIKIVTIDAVHDGMVALSQAYWPGNMEHLHNVIANLALTVDSEITGEHVRRLLGETALPPPSAIAPEVTARFFELPLREAREAFERIYFEQLLGKEQSNMSRVADRAGLERTHLYRKLKQLNIRFARRSDEAT